MDDLFGTDSDNSDGEMKITSQPDELPSTQQHLDDLFGESDEDEEKNNSDNENQNIHNGSDEEASNVQNDSSDDFNVQYQSDDAQSENDDAVAPTPVRTTSYESGGTPVNDDSDDDENLQPKQRLESPVLEESDNDDASRIPHNMESPAQYDSDENDTVQHQQSHDSLQDVSENENQEPSEFVQAKDMSEDEEERISKRTEGVSDAEQELDFGNNEDEALFKEMAQDHEATKQADSERTAEDDAFFKEMTEDQGDSDIEGRLKDGRDSERQRNDEAFFREMADDQEDSDNNENIIKGSESERNINDEPFLKNLEDNQDASDDSKEGKVQKMEEGKEKDKDAFLKELGADQDESDDEIMFRKKSSSIKRSSDQDDESDDERKKSDLSDGEDEKRKLDEDESEKMIPTTQDLFGEDVDVSSDEEEEEEVKPKPMISDDDDEDNERDEAVQKPKLDTNQFAREPSPEKEEGLSISIELPRCNISLGKELYFIKLPNFLSVDTKPFDPNFYEDEIDEDEIIDEEGKARLKLKVENTIRWRYSKDKDGNEIKESNCRFVRWSDGSISMHLGNEVFDVFKMPISGEQNHLFVQQGTGLQAQAVFKNKLSFRPQSTSSQTHQKMILSIADRLSKSQKIKMMPATEKDPESQREGLLKKEEEFLRSQARRDAQTRKQRDRERSSHKSLNSSYLEQDVEEEEDLDTSLAAIKNRYKQSIKGGPGKAAYDDIYSSDDDSEAEKKIKKAKLDSSSDEEEPKAQEPKKKVKKVIEESDDDDDDDSD